jgi:hypothetical protein
MAEANAPRSARPLRPVPVKLVRGKRELPATVEHPHNLPWRVIEQGSKPGNGPAPVPWEVMLFVPGSEPLVFRSRKRAQAWAATAWAGDKHERRRRYVRDALEEPASVERDDRTVPEDAGVASSKAATARFRAFARRHDLDPESHEAFKRAHEAKVIRSVVLRAKLGCEGDYQVVDDYLADWDRLGLNWRPQSCRSFGQGTLYAEAFGKTYGGRSALIVGSDCVDDLPFAVGAVEAA